MQPETAGNGVRGTDQTETGGNRWLAPAGPVPGAYVPLVLAGILAESAVRGYGPAGISTLFCSILVVLAGLWYGRRALIVAVLFGVVPVAAGYQEAGTISPDTLIPACGFVILALVAGTAAEQMAGDRNRLAARNRELAQAGTRLEASQNAMVTANRKLNLLSSITRHGIRNQLLVLTGFIGLARMKVTDPELLHYIERQEEAALAIQRQIEFTKTYEDLGVLAPQWQDAGMRMHALRTQVPHGGIEFSIDTEGLEILADPLFGKVLENLVDNSRSPGSVRHVSLSVLRDGPGSIALVYADDGPGIRDADKERIFAKGSGNGFGLFLSREILAITGIGIQETGVYGRGARFEIRVPEGNYRFRPQQNPEAGSTPSAGHDG